MTHSTSYTPYGDYLLDWDLTGSDGSAMLSSSSGGDQVGVTVSTPKNDHEQFELKYGELKSDDVEEPVEAIITFDTAVTDVNFQIKDIDQGWFHDDKVTVLAYDADGNLVDVEFSDLQAGQTVSGNTINGGAKLSDQGVTVSVAGPIVKLVVIHDNGESDHESGYIKITDMGFNAVIDPRDGIVEGTTGDDLIDLAYDGDPDGDMVDAGDALLPGEVGDDDIIVAGAGNDTVLAGEGNDEVFGGGGDDLIDGGAGNDVIYGDGDGPVDVATQDLIVNGSFEDTSGMTTTGYGYVSTGAMTGWNTLDPNNEIDIHNDDRGSVEASDGDNWLDLGASPANIAVYQDVDGVAPGETYTLTFSAGDADFDGQNGLEVWWGGEKLATIDPPEGTMQEYSFTVTGGAGDGSDRLLFVGTGPADHVGVSVDSVSLVASGGMADEPGNDTILGGEGDDLVFGGGGDDEIYGEAGNDTLYGDDGAAGGGTTTVRESLNWSEAPNFGNMHDASGFTQDTGNVDVTFSILQESGHADTRFETSTQNIAGIEDDGAPVNATSSFESVTNGKYNEADYQLAFSDPVSNVSFRVNDIDGDGVVKITAYDADGNKIPVQLSGGSKLTLLDTDGVPGADTADSKGGYLDDSSSEYSLLVDIAGPVSRIVIEHDQNGYDNSGVNITDVFFDVEVSDGGASSDGGNDTIDGGEGDDLIYGEGGNDLLMGGEGNDTIYGDSGPGTPGAPGVAKALVWEDVASDGTQLGGSTDYDAGGVNVNIAFTGLDHGATGSISNNTQYTEAGEGLDPDSSLQLYGAGGGAGFEDTSLTTLAFSSTDSAYGDEVQNVFFRINDVDTGNDFDDHIDRVTVLAFDAEGNEVDVVLTPTGVQDVNGNTVTGTTEDNGNVNPEDALGSVEVAIAGPVARIEILYQNGEDTDQAIWVTDVTFETTAPDGVAGEGGDDTIIGGAGADVMYGEGGNDTFIVASAEDGAGDVITGGNGPDDTTDHDVLDLRGAGKVTIDQTADETDEGAIKGTVTFADGSTLSFSQIEEILTDPQNEAPVAVDDDAVTDEDTPVIIDVLANDTDVDGDDLEVTSATSPDGTVDINPDGTITFTPDQDFNGTTTIEYTVSDGNGGTDTATVTVEVNPVNDDPVGGDDSATTDEDTPVIIDVLANDTDVDGDDLEVTSVGDPANGTAEINPDGTITYTPDPDYNGPDSFTYTVSDGNGGTDTATVTIDVTPVNDDPVAEDDAAKTPINMPVVIAVLANDSDVDGDPLTVISATSPDGTVDINPDGTITFTPDTDFFGETTIDYTISDGNGGTDSAVVTLLVNDGIVSGTDGDDLIDVNYTGDPEGDMVDAGDNIFPGSGPEDDVIQAGDGNDTVIAGLGDDHVDGGAGDDLIFGGDGDDTLIGGDGSDTVYGGAGDDHIDTSGSNPMTDYGYPPFLPEDTDKEDDRDFVDGGDGNDTIFTGDDRDTIYGGAGNDYIDGGLDDDLIDGGDGDDTIIGGHGSDEIHGGDGNDLIYGGLGPDPSLDPLNIQDENDPIYGIDDPRPDNGIDVIHGGAGNDTIFGQDDADLLYGDEGDDYIDGGIDNDTIFGGEGDDELLGGQGDDLIDGGPGNDTMKGGDDRDTFVNVNAGDLIYGGEGGDDWDTLDLTGSVPTNGSYTITYTSPNQEDGFVSYFDENNDPTGTLNFYEIEKIIPCFTPGTLIATPKGERRVEELQAGDRVITRDNGIQEIKWAGHKPIGFRELAASEHLRPVLIRAGALGNGLPERDMMVSPNHRVLVANDRTALYFDEREVLAAAKHLVDNKGIMSVEPLGVTYVHFMFEHHEVVLSDGAWTESFQPGDYSLKGIGNAQRQELFELFPELETQDGLEDYTAARRILKKHEAQMLLK